MKKISTVIFFILLSSCGIEVQDQKGSNVISSIGEISTYQETTFSDSEVALIRSACNALSTKDSFYKSTYVDREVFFQFENEEKTCDSDAISKFDSELMLKRQNNTISFVNMRGDGKKFFSEYESHEQGMLSSFCKAISSGKGQDLKSSERLQGAHFVDWYTITNASSLCGVEGAVCFIKTRGFELPSGGERYQTKFFDKIAINLQHGPRYGAIVKRESISSYYCRGANEVQFLRSTRTN